MNQYDFGRSSEDAFSIMISAIFKRNLSEKDYCLSNLTLLDDQGLTEVTITPRKGSENLEGESIVRRYYRHHIADALIENDFNPDEFFDSQLIEMTPEERVGCFISTSRLNIKPEEIEIHLNMSDDDTPQFIVDTINSLSFYGSLSYPPL